MVFKNHSFRFFFIRVFFLFSFSALLNASVSLNDYPQIKSYWDDGELTLAIDQLQEEAKKGSQNDDIADLFKKLSFQKKKFDQWLLKAEHLLKQQKFKEATEVLSFIESINPNYIRYRELMNKIATAEEELKYPFNMIFDGKHLEDMWKPYEAHRHHFSEYAKFENNALVVNVPKKRGWAQVGIESSETIINFTESNQSYAYRLKFKFDPNDTKGFGIELEGRNIDKSRSINKLQVFYKKIDENSSVLELRKDYGDLHSKLEMGGVTPGSMEILVQPNNMMYLYLPDGRYLQTTSAKYTMPTKGYTLKVYSRPIKNGFHSKMSLKSIELKREPFKKRVNLSNLGKKEKKTVLFDGKYLGNRWIPFNEQYKKYFRKYARFDNNGFMIDIPKDNKWAEAGLISPEPIVWLDGLGRDGEYKLIFSFDPSRTTGFTVGAGSYNSFWKSPAKPSVSLNWSQIADQNVSKLKIYIENKLLLEEKLTAVPPSIIAFGFKDGNVTFSGDTFKNKSFKWSYIVENRPLHLWAFSRAYKSNLPAKMALGKIILERKIATPTSPPKPALGVESLPEKEILGSKNFEGWKCYKFSADKKDNNCTLELSSFYISIEKGKKSLYAIKSKNKIIRLDSRRIDVTPLKVNFSFDPSETNSFHITISGLHIVLQKNHNHTYSFQIYRNPVYKSERDVDEEWLENNWNGKVQIVAAKKWTRIALGNGVKIFDSNRISPESELSVSALGIDQTAEFYLHMKLKKITTQWLVPDGMTATDRWNLIDDEDFDPDEFLKELREGK